jgi:hypothetical protein
MDATAVFMDGLPRLNPARVQHATIMDAMGQIAPERHLCLTDTIPARVAAHDGVQVARLLTDQDIEEMRAHRDLARRITRRLLRTEHIFDTRMADEAMRAMRDRGEVDDETRQRIMRVKTDRKRMRAFCELLDTRVDRHTLPVEAACVV